MCCEAVRSDGTCSISQAPTCGGTCPELSCCPNGQVCAQTSGGNSCACVCNAQTLPCPFVTKWGSQGGGDGQFANPTGVAVDGSGHVFVADSGNDRIQKFTNTGTFLTKWGSQGSGDGQFSNPTGVAVDGSGNVFVADAANYDVNNLTNTGTFAADWGAQNGAGRLGVVNARV